MDLVYIRVDTSTFDAAVNELASLSIEIGEQVPQGFFEAFLPLGFDLSEEVAICQDISTPGAGEKVIRLELAPGGRVERLLAALRALRAEVADRLGNGHGGLRVEG